MDNIKTSSGYRLIFGYLGYFLIFIALIILLPLILLPFYPTETTYIYYFLIPAALTLVAGLLLSLLNYKRKLTNLKKNEDLLLVLLIWLAAILFSALPFTLSGTLTYSQSVFEITSGYTTTGMTIMDVEALPHVFLFYRSLTHYIGGVGLVLVLTSAITDKLGIKLFAAEGHDDRLLPNLRKTALFIFAIYTLYIALGTLLYALFGMPLFDALNHAISAVSTGGFSTRAASIAAYNSRPIEIVTIVLMVLGATNFMLHFYLFKRQFKKIIKHFETIFFLIYSVVFVTLLTLTLNVSYGSGSLRVTSFLFFSTMSSTGLLNGGFDFSAYSSAFIFLLIIVILIGGGIRSTAGGIKFYRVSLLLKSLQWNVGAKLRSRNVVKINYIYNLGTKQKITAKDIVDNNSFVVLYLLLILCGTFIFALFGYDLTAALFEVSSLIGNTGLTSGIMSVHSAQLLIWTGSLLMLLGRLEIYAVINAVLSIRKD